MSGGTKKSASTCTVSSIFSRKCNIIEVCGDNMVNGIYEAVFSITEEGRVLYETDSAIELEPED